jgi:hypothetical protein
MNKQEQNPGGVTDIGVGWVCGLVMEWLFFRLMGGEGFSLIFADWVARGLTRIFFRIVISGIENRIIIKKVKKCLQILNSQGAWITALKGRHTSAMWGSPSLRDIVKKRQVATTCLLT